VDWARVDEEEMTHGGDSGAEEEVMEQSSALDCLYHCWIYILIYS